MGDKQKRTVGEVSPPMSTTSVLVSVEDLIHMAMGPESVNIVNFKLLQTVLHILARQMRLLEQRVEVKISDYITVREEDKESSPERGSPRDRDARRADKDAARADREAAKAEKDAAKTAARADKEAFKAGAKAEKEASKAEKEAAKASAKAEKDSAKAEKEASKAEKEAAKAGAKAEKEASKAEKEAAKVGAKAEKEASKAEKEAAKAEKEAAKAGAKAEKEASKGEKEAAKAGAKAEKEASKAEKEAAKAGAKSEKEAAKAERAGQKTAEREKKDLEKTLAAEAKEKQKQEKAAAKEEKASEKEKDKAERAASKEREKDAKAATKAAKEEEKAKEKQERDKSKDRGEVDKAKGGKAGKGKAGESDEEVETAGTAKGGKGGKSGKKAPGAKVAGSDTSIVITEAERDKQKVLVVEKGPTTRSAAGAGGPGSRSIEVVTRSQFDILKELVSDLAEKAGPLPMPSLPKNKELLQRLSKGTASLTDMMGAMQVNARVKAAEQAIGRMGGILTQLATAGALPEDIAGQVGEVTSELTTDLKEAGGGQVSGVGVGGGRVSTAGGGFGARASQEGLEGARPSKSAASAASRKSILSARSKYSAGGSASTRPSTVSGSGSVVFQPKVTHPELDDAVRTMKEDMMKNMQHITAKAASAAENAMVMAKAVADKLDIATKLNGRISTLYSQVTDYAEQLSGFDAGLSTQMQGFSEQMVQMRADLKQGLNLLESVNNNAETAAVLELTERYEGLVTELDHTLHFHQELTTRQGELGDDLHGLIEAVEMLREQKADRDEVLDGLRDKADNSRLAGLLTEEEFARSRIELERRLAVCHDKFHRQDEVWMQAIKEMKMVTDVKADLIQLLGLRDEAQEALQMLHQMCQNLALVLGEPKAAVLTRKLSRGATCAACLAPALMEPEDEFGGAPPPLPAARPRPTGAPAIYEEPCEREFKLPEPPDTRDHICHRWVGGSHTLVPQGVVTRAHAEPMTYDAPPTNRFTGYGNDGRLYMMEEELQPCLECNQLSDEAGAGDKPKGPLPSIAGKPD